MFKDPSAGGDRLVYIELENALLLITVKGQEHGIETSFGTADPIRADVAVLDGPHKGDEYHDALIFPKMLISQLRSNEGEMVIGRLGKGTAKPGQSAPWTLAAATDADKAVGERYLAYAAQRAVEEEAPF
jgi:hypothetical protein